MVHASDGVLWVGGGGALTYVQVNCGVQVSWIRAFLIQVLKLFLQRHDSSTLFSLAPNQGPGGPGPQLVLRFFTIKNGKQVTDASWDCVHSVRGHTVIQERRSQSATSRLRRSGRTSWLT